MTRLDEFLGPLDNGVWEVTVPKQSVTEPLDPGWKKSALNVPSPETLDSYRKGRYHVHETATEWKVHLDNYDPKVHPYLHLIDDAPLLLMIGDTFVTLIEDARRKSGDTMEILEGQERTWRLQVISGIFIMLFGVLVILYPLDFFGGIVTIILPLAIIALGCATFWNRKKTGRNRSPGYGAFEGIAIVVVGIIVWFLPVEFWALLILAILTVWMVASGLILLVRASKGREAIPEGFASRIIIAIGSLIFVVLILVEPAGALKLLVAVVGVIAVLIGLMLTVNGTRLGKRMKTARM